MLYGAEDYDATGKDRDTMINEIAESYGTDYVALATAYGDETYFDDSVKELAQEYLVAQKTAAVRARKFRTSRAVKKLGRL